MTFTFIQVLAMLFTMGLYKPWERVARLVCKKYFDKELPQEFCTACAITLFLVIGALLQIAK